MDSLLKSTKGLLGKVFPKKTPEEVARQQEQQATRLQEKRDKRALKRYRRNARMERDGNH
ncbi:hypothetical protein NW768_002603 [Fusarium equiseti]|uniref:Uncharacterized protein n=1 Tax=Fusarium equiseti TaxID=61235 RepID=A0ABQ8RPR3_FUSEQ|nr:hypothetical protein NW768_002603 [Fusarium equiseti]